MQPLGRQDGGAVTAGHALKPRGRPTDTGRRTIGTPVVAPGSLAVSAPYWDTLPVRRWTARSEGQNGTREEWSAHARHGRRRASGRARRIERPVRFAAYQPAAPFAPREKRRTLAARPEDSSGPGPWMAAGAAGRLVRWPPSFPEHRTAPSSSGGGGRCRDQRAAGTPRCPRPGGTSPGPGRQGERSQSRVVGEWVVRPIGGPSR
jgi:hypothetical protein